MMEEWINQWIGDFEKWNIYLQIKYMIMILGIEAFASAACYLSGNLKSHSRSWPRRSD